MRHLQSRVSVCVAGLLAAGAAVAAPPKITGIAFVGNQVTSKGSKATLPADAKIYPPGAKITGTEGCPKDAYGTTGLIVAVIDYDGKPTAGSLTISVVPPPQFGGRPPYYLDINPGRTLQFLGPIRDNGTYELKLEGGFARAQAEQTKSSITFTLARTCAAR